MYVVIDQRTAVVEGFSASFAREGVPALGLASEEFWEWLEAASPSDLSAVQSFFLGEFDARKISVEMIRSHCRAPIIALNDMRSLQQTLDLLTSGIDDVVEKPVHVRELIARSHAIWRRRNAPDQRLLPGRLKVFFDGRDPEVDAATVALPRRERHILEYLVKNSNRWLTKTQIFNAIYGIFNDDVDESVVEGHMSKLRKKLRIRLGYDVIEAKRYAGYRFDTTAVAAEAPREAVPA